MYKWIGTTELLADIKFSTATMLFDISTLKRSNGKQVGAEVQNKLRFLLPTMWMIDKDLSIPIASHTAVWYFAWVGVSPLIWNTYTNACYLNRIIRQIAS